VVYRGRTMKTWGIISLEVYIYTYIYIYIYVGKKFGDIPRGIFIVRGENVVLLREIDVEKPCDTVLQQVSIEEILEEQRLQQQTKQETEKVKMQVLKDRGLSIPKADNLDEY
uniref:LSM1, U6 small nuclear RNA associated n=1 Tax=Amphiprion percula TaxID=161767 RepID=A0A3P8S673_AMPPE